MDLKIEFERTHTAVLSDIDYWLCIDNNFTELQAEELKKKFAAALYGKPANFIVVASMATEVFKIKGFDCPPWDLVKSSLKIEGDAQILRIGLDYSKIWT